MKAIIGCAIENKPGEWFVQLRIPSYDIFDQHVISNAWGPTREDAIENARRLGEVSEVIEWSFTRMTPNGVVRPKSDLLSVMARCGAEIDALCQSVNRMHRA